MGHRVVAVLVALWTIPLLIVGESVVSSSEPIVTDLRSAGYSLIPAPQEVNLEGGDVVLDSTWGIVSDREEDHIVLRRLKEGAQELHGLEFDGTGSGKIKLLVRNGTVRGIENPASGRQAYRISISPDEVEIAGNDEPGLLYGVQSFLQLLRREGHQWYLPAGIIQDWPTLELRFVHWDTKHHQDRPETLKRFIDWASFFKVNAIGFEIEDKYEYPSNPIIGAPGAFTREEMEDLVGYALKRHIQLVPQIQSPAHMAYVLKHKEMVHLRADGSNYQICMCDEEAIELIQEMYQDLIDATPGVEYFHVSTDEVYYAGICSKCQEQRPYNDENRSLTWLEYVIRMHSWLAERGRKMLCWVEYPLSEKHLDRLPRGLINGVIGPGNSDRWIRGLKTQGVHSLVYSSQQGGEHLFPNYFSSDYLYRGKPIQSRLDDPAVKVAAMLEKDADVIGTYAAAWGDTGLHNELFWLGWATVTQYGWTPSFPSVEQNVADFMDVFYGPSNQDLAEVYKVLMEGARFYDSSLDRVPARRLKPRYGSWAGKGRDIDRADLTMQPPALPFSVDEVLISSTRFSNRYARILELALPTRKNLNWAIRTLQGKLNRSTRNRYNLEVMLSVAYFEKHFVDMVLGLEQVEQTLHEASTALAQERNQHTLSLLVRAHDEVNAILTDQDKMWAGLKTTWEKSHYPKGRSVDGRQFVHVLDDVKDHRADRRPGLDYLLEPLENIGLETWNQQLAEFIRTFAASRGWEAPEL